MKTAVKSIYIFFIILMMPLLAVSQKSSAIDSTNNSLIHAAKEIMNAAETCALITLDEEGHPRVRAMDPFAPDDDLSVWFGTNAKSRKVDQIKKDPRVSLYYLDSDASGYVMIYGMAQLINDPQEKEKRWKAEWEAFYPNKAENYLLIKVRPLWMEVSSTPRGIFGDTISWQPPTVFFDALQ